MVISASTVSQLMRLKAKYVCKPLCIPSDNLLCECANNTGTFNCDQSVKPPTLGNCSCLDQILLDCSSARSYEDYTSEIWEMRNFNRTSIVSSRLNKYRKLYRRIISPHHRHIYEDYNISSTSDVRKYWGNYMKTKTNEAFMEYFDGSSYLEDFWNCCETDAEAQLQKKMIYKSASLQYDAVSADERILQQAVRDMWRFYRADSTHFHLWIYKLRVWLSATILERIVKEIDSVNNQLNGLGFNMISVGSCGLNVLESMSSSVPNLPLLISFLEITPYQNYIVQRIKELARGGCLADYRWNSGGTYMNAPWKNSLPTDAALMMHLLCTYLDSVLPLYYNQKPFTSKYFTKDQCPDMKTGIKIYESSGMPPHFKLLISGETHELPTGKNNIFYVILFFLKYIHRNESSSIENISLGKSGLNMLWIIS